jgi:hypothetical protein
MPVDLISNLLVSGETRFFADEIDSQDISFGEYWALAPSLSIHERVSTVTQMIKI